MRGLRPSRGWRPGDPTASSDGVKWDATYPTMHRAALPTLGPKHKAQLPMPTVLRLSSSAQPAKSGSLPSMRPGPLPRDDMATCHTGNGALTVAPSEAFRLPPTPPLSPHSLSHLLSPPQRFFFSFSEENESSLCQTLARALSLLWGESWDLMTKAKG